MLSLKRRKGTICLGPYNKSKNYTWKECSDKTFEYLSLIAKKLIMKKIKIKPPYNWRYWFIRVFFLTVPSQ
jgi:hypothetical protein